MAGKVITTLLSPIKSLGIVIYNEYLVPFLSLTNSGLKIKFEGGIGEPVGKGG